MLKGMPVYGHVMLAMALLYLLGIFVWITFPLIPWAIIGGTKPPVEVFALFLTPLGAVAAVVGLVLNALANRKSFDLTRRVQISTNFQRGAEMLDSRAKSAKLAGVAVLVDVALQDPENQMRPVLATLVHFLEEHCDEDWQAAGDVLGQGLPYTTSNDALCMDVLGRLSGLMRQNSRYASTARPIINRFTITNWTGADLSLFRINLHNAIFHLAKFDDETLERAAITAYVGETVVFTGCTFQRVAFKFMDFQTTELLKPNDIGRIQFTDCTADDATTVNGMSFTDWLAASKKRTRRRRAAVAE